VRIVWSPRALARLEAEHAFIEEQNPTAADNVIERVMRVVQRLEHFPHSGRPGLRRGEREVVVPALPYLLPYRVRRNRVEILDVVHTSRKRASRRPPESSS
jgi:toxin ParE1/3/4